MKPRFLARENANTIVAISGAGSAVITFAGLARANESSLRPIHDSTVSVGNNRSAGSHFHAPDTVSARTRRTR